MSSLTDKQPGRSNRAVRFLLNGNTHVVENTTTTTTLLNYLREELQHTGTKEGCAEGDCGACTVVVAENHDGELRFRSVNSCIQFLPTLDGKAVYTVEGLKSENGSLHPVQQAMVDCHGSQCGFCTPGFVMSLFSLYKNQDQADRNEIDDALAGNLCRCTGYRPIIDAASRMYELAKELDSKESNPLNIPGPGGDTSTLLEDLASIRPQNTLRLESDGFFFAPVTLEDFSQVYLDNPKATILAGGTDVGLWVTKQYRELDTILYIGNVAELKNSSVSDGHLVIGAAVNLTDAFSLIHQHYPDLDEIARRFASPPIRNSGTLCGNIANGSPIGDSMPALISLGASLRLRRGDQTRICVLDDFYIDYQVKDLQEGEFVEAVCIPLPDEQSTFRSYKISKRFDQDISAVCLAVKLKLVDDEVRDIRICYGGMAAIPKRASACEKALINQPWNEKSLEKALPRLADDFQPLTDMRASAGYRAQVAANLLRRFYLETSQDSTVLISEYAE